MLLQDYWLLILRVAFQPMLAEDLFHFGQRLSSQLHLASFLTCNPLHFHASSLNATLGESLLGDDAADVIGEDEVGLQDWQGLGVRVGARFMNNNIQSSAVVLDTRHLHVLLERRRKTDDEEDSISNCKKGSFEELL